MNGEFREELKRMWKEKTKWDSYWININGWLTVSEDLVGWRTCFRGQRTVPAESFILKMQSVPAGASHITLEKIIHSSYCKLYSVI